MLVFPSVIQNPSFPIDITYEDIALQSRKENGVVKVRKKFSNARITFKLTWNTMSVFDYKVLEDFYINDCETNVNEFIWRYPNVANNNDIIPNSVFHKHSFLVRFDEFSAKANEYSYYTVSVTLKGQVLGKLSGGVYGEIIPIVYGNISTYLIDNTAIDGTLVWGEETSNSDTGYVNNYTTEKYFTNVNIIDADINQNTGEVYTAYVTDPNNKYIISPTNPSNGFSIKRNDTEYKDIPISFLMNGIRSKVYPCQEKIHEKIDNLAGVNNCVFTPNSFIEESVFKNFKVDSDGYFYIVSVPSYKFVENFSYKQGPKTRIESSDNNFIETRSTSSSERNVIVNVDFIATEIDDYINASSNYGIDVVTTCNISDKQNFVLVAPYLNNDFKTIETDFSYVSYRNKADVLIYLNWALTRVGSPNPRYGSSTVKESAKAEAEEIYRPKYPNCRITYYGNSNYAGYTSSYITRPIYYDYEKQDIVLSDSLWRFDNRIDHLLLRITKAGADDFHDQSRTVQVVILCSVDVTLTHTKANVNLNSILEEYIQENFSFIDVKIQNNHFARFTCNNGSTINNTSYTFIGLYSSAGYFISKPSINIDITDNLSLIKLSDDSYLLGIYKKGLYWLKKDGTTVELVSNNLYNFRLNYKQRKM